MTGRSVQYRVVVAKSEERIEGPDGADVVITVGLADVQAEGFDPTVSFMRGRLKSAGSTGALFERLRSGDAGAAVSRLASPT